MSINTSSWRNWLYVLDQLDPGQSLFIPEPANINHHGSLRQTIHHWAKYPSRKKTFCCRSRVEGGFPGMRVWRLE